MKMLKKVAFTMFFMVSVELAVVLSTWILFNIWSIDWGFYSVFNALALFILYSVATHITSSNKNKSTSSFYEYLIPSICAFFVHIIFVNIYYYEFSNGEIVLSFVLAAASFFGAYTGKKRTGKKIFLGCLAGLFVFILTTLIFYNYLYKTKNNLVSEIMKGDIFEVKILLEKGVNVNDDSNLKGAPILWAAYKGDVDIFEMLLSYGANCDEKSVLSLDSGRNYPTALAAAVGEGNYKVAKYILNNCDLNLNEKVAINSPIFFPEDILSVQRQL